MKAKMKNIWRKIGFCASYLVFMLLSVFFLFLLYESNEYFFAFPYQDSIFTAGQLDTILSVFLTVCLVLVVLLTVLSFTMRQKKGVNKALLWACGIFSVLCMVFFMVLCKLNGLFEVAFENTNLYALYFLIAAFSTAVVLFSAIRNLVKIKKAPVTFAKSRPAEKAAAQETAPAEEASV